MNTLSLLHAELAMPVGKAVKLNLTPTVGIFILLNLLTPIFKVG